MKPSGVLSPIQERHSPQHPLPEEILKMETDETVCQFCGVSYLIHHEMKRLEENAKALERELLKCRTCQDNEKKLRNELNEANATNESLQAIVSKNDALIEDRQSEMDELRDANSKLLRNESTLKEDTKKFKEDILAKSWSLKGSLSVAKTEISAFKLAIKPAHSEFARLLARLKKVVEMLCVSFEAERRSMCQEIQELHDELGSRYQNEDVLQSTINFIRKEIEISQKKEGTECYTCKQKNEKLLLEVSALKCENTDLVENLSTVKSQYEMLKSDYAQMREAVNKKHLKVQAAVQNLYKVEQNARLTIQQLNQKINLLEQTFSSLYKEKSEWKKAEEDLKKQLEEQKRQICLHSGESQQMLDSFQEAEQELLEMKFERERMVISHQRQISQLKETFQEKLSAADEYPKELEEKIKGMKDMHDKEMMELELHLKENFAIEIGIEKEKHDLEIKASSKNLGELHKQALSAAKMEVQQLSMDLQMFQTQSSIMKSQHLQEISELKDEKENLTKLVAQHEQKVASLIGQEEGFKRTCQVELQEAKEGLHTLLDEKLQLHQQVDSLKNEVLLLQDTVQKECEERFELTKALCSAQEQLVRSSKPNSLLVRTPVSVINGLQVQEFRLGSTQSSKAQQSSNSGMEIAPSQQVLLEVLPRNLIRRNSDIGMSLSGDDSAHVDIAFPQQPSPSLGKQAARAGSEESVEMVRRRIAVAIRRK